jgi:hypothetical protein
MKSFELLRVSYNGSNEVMDERIREYIGHSERQCGFFIPTNERDLSFDVPTEWESWMEEELMDIGQQFDLNVQIVDAI